METTLEWALWFSLGAAIIAALSLLTLTVVGRLRR